MEIKNEYDLNNKLTHNTFTLLTRAFANTDIKIFKGPFVTVSTITASDQRAANIYRNYQPCMEAMEGAAAAYLSCFYAIPLIEIRSASNFVGNRDKNQWNLPLAFKNAAAATKACIELIQPPRL